MPPTQSELYQSLPDATVQIYDGENPDEGYGSGFHFRSDRLVITNAHVAMPHLNRGNSIFARTESGESRELNLLYESPADSGHDFAILEVDRDWDSDRLSLMPERDTPERGNVVLFGGFPLGLENLLTHRARVSGYSDNGFFIDGAVNQANSGGPIVSWESGLVLGVVTFKGFVSPESLQDLIHHWMKLRRQARQGGGGIAVGGVDPAALAEVTVISFDALENLIRTNASTGIGGAINISYIDDTIDNKSFLD